MPYIYKIVNLINDKVYIGQTVRPIDKRLYQHTIDSKRLKDHESIKLYRAMQKYGADKFFVEIVEICDSDKLDEREIYWIEKYDSFKNGYNTTKGGHGRKFVEDSNLMKLWKDGYTLSEIKEQTGHAIETISVALKRTGITRNEIIERAVEVRRSKVVVPVYQYTLDGDFVCEYLSVYEAEKETGIDKGCILGVIYKEHHSAGNYQWSKQKVDNIGKCKHKRPYSRMVVHQYNMNGDYVATYESAGKASANVGLTSGKCIIRVCKGESKKAGGYLWSFERYNNLLEERS